MSEITQVTVVPSDKLIIVNGEVLVFDWEPIEENIHAIQYHNNSGHIEYEDGSPNISITSEDYETKVKPYVDLWQVEKNRILEEQRKAKEEYNSVIHKLWLYSWNFNEIYNVETNPLFLEVLDKVEPFWNDRLEW